MKKQSSLRSEAGFGLMGVLMASALSMVVIAGVAESLINMVRAQKSTELARQSAAFGDSLEQTLQDEAVCTAALGGMTVPNVSSSLITSATIKLGGSNIPLVPNTDILGERGLQTARFDIAASSDPGDLIFPFSMNTSVVKAGLPAGNYQRKILKLNFQTKKSTTGLFAPTSAVRTIRLQAMVLTATNKIVSCNGESDDVLACQMSGGVWNSAAADGKKCVPYQYCEWGGAFTQPTLSAAQGGFKNQVTGSYGCNSGFSAYQTGVVANSARASGSKVAINNNMQPIYTCMRCGGGMTSAGMVASSAYGASTTSVPISNDVNTAVSDLDYAADNYNDAADCIKSATCGLPTATPTPVPGGGGGGGGGGSVGTKPSMK